MKGILYRLEQNGGLVGKNMAHFFELRFGHAFHEAGIALEYEVPGEGDSTLDFGFTSKGATLESRDDALAGNSSRQSRHEDGN